MAAGPLSTNVLRRNGGGARRGRGGEQRKKNTLVDFREGIIICINIRSAQTYAALRPVYNFVSAYYARDSIRRGT